MSHPKRADHFREWSKLMLEQAIVPERVQYKSSAISKKSGMKVQGGGLAGHHRKRRRRRKRRGNKGRKD